MTDNIPLQITKHHPNILLAEDDLINQEVTLEMLALIGCNVKLVENGNELLTIISQENFDLILMDCEMPEMSGFQVTKEIRRGEFSTGKRVPVIALTAHALVGYKERCLAAGMDDYLSKPFNQEQLKEVLLRWLHLP